MLTNPALLMSRNMIKTGGCLKWVPDRCSGLSEESISIASWMPVSVAP